MMTAEELMERYKKVREEEKMNGGLGIITNPKAMIGGILIVGMNPSGEGDDIYDYRLCNGNFWYPKHYMMGGCDNGYDKKCGYIDLLPVRNGDQFMVHC